MLRQAARKIVQQVSGVEQESQIHHFFNRYPIENVASPLDCWAAVVRPQWNAGPIWFSTGVCHLESFHQKTCDLPVLCSETVELAVAQGYKAASCQAH